MTKRVLIYIDYKNIVVLKTYLDVIKKAFEEEKYECLYIETIDIAKKDDIIVVPMGIDAFRFYIKGYKNIVLWQQGVTSEESFMRNHCYLRKKVLNLIDCFSMKKAKMIFYVSNELKTYYEKEAKTSFSKKSYIMPCFNETFVEDTVDKKDYKKKVFSYVGSIDLWQCFEETVQLYSMIEQMYPDSFFKVLTFKVDEARKIINSYGIKNYSVKCVPKEEVKQQLEECTYGFIIRKNIVVNQVATPTKFSSYLSSGVLPIFSSCITDFYLNFKNSPVACVADDLDNIFNFINKKHDNNEIKINISSIFNTYYNIEFHKEEIKKLINDLIH